MNTKMETRLFRHFGDVRIFSRSCSTFFRNLRLVVSLERAAARVRRAAVCGRLPEATAERLLALLAECKAGLTEDGGR